MSEPPDVSISGLLRKTEHYDKDERYMATSDLCEVLKRQQQQQTNPTSELDSKTEHQICAAVLRLLHDQSNDVQAVAVKTLGVLLMTVKEAQVFEIADSLADQVLDATKSELRDVYAIGLRTLVKIIPFAMGNAVSQRLVGRMLEGIKSSENEEIVLVCLDILTDVLTRFGGNAQSVTRQHEPILQMCLTELANDNAVVRKRAGTAMGCLSVVLSDALLMRMVEALLSQIDMAQGVGKEGRRKTRSAHAQAKSTQTKRGDTCSLIRTMCTVSGAVGHRLGQTQIDRILPIFLRFAEPQDAATGDDEDMQDDDEMEESEDEAAVALANELRESCFMGFESFVLRCPNEVEPHMTKIIQAALAYMSYDPNYSYGAEDSDEEVDEDQEEEENDYDQDEEDLEEEDDDDSWKVRRSAIRALRAVVESKKNNPSSLWKTEYAVCGYKSTTVAAALVARFKEREENCRIGIIDCFTRLMSLTIQASSSGVISFSSPDEMDTSSALSIDLRNYYARKLVKACEKILAVKKGIERSKSSALALLATLCKAPGGVGGESEIASVFRLIKTLLTNCGDEQALREGVSKTLRLDALSLVYAILTSNQHDPVHIRKSLRQSLIPELCDAVKEKWYKVIAEALRTLAAVPSFFVTGYSKNDDGATKKKEQVEVASLLYAAIEPLLAAHDVDQEIKECALKACGTLLTYLHDSLDKESESRLLQLLLERLNNETTRLYAIKTFASIAASARDDSADDKHIDLSSIVAKSISDLASCLKLQSRSVRQSALEALDIVVTNHSTLPDLANGELFSSVVQDLATMMNDSDLHLSHLSLRASVSVLQVCPNAGPAVKAHALEPALTLSTSSLLQDLALNSLLEFFKQLIVSQAVEFDELLFLLRQRLVKISKTGVYNLSKSIAVITAASTPENNQKVLSEMLSTLEGAAAPCNSAKVRQLQLALLVTGDLGRMVDMGQLDGAAERLKVVYMSYFDATSEDLKSAAAYALGNASVGSQAIFLPSIVRKLDEDNTKQQYLLLLALREFIQCSFDKSVGVDIASSMPIIVPTLVKHGSDDEEGVRTMVAECIGLLTCLHPESMLPKLLELQEQHCDISAPGGMIADGDDDSKKNALVSWSIATSVKLSIAGKVNASQLSVFMPKFVKMLKQEEIGVRNAALLMTYAASHHMPKIVASLLQDSIMPSLYEISNLKLERKVDLGPFTHKVDDALPLRKSALSIFATCLESLPGSLDINDFIPILVKALGDAEDIQLHAHQIVISMCSSQPTHLLASIESFVEPLEKNLNRKPGQKVGTELERLNDWIKSALRVVLALSKLEGAMNVRAFADFVNRSQNNSKFAAMIESLQHEA